MTSPRCLCCWKAEVLLLETIGQCGDVIMYQSNRSFNIPQATPRAFEFLANFCSNPSLPGPKSCSNAPTRTCLRVRSAGLFPQQWLVIEPRKLLFILQKQFQYIYIFKDRCKLVLTTPSNTEQSLCRPLVFNQSATNTYSFLWFSNPLGIMLSAPLVTWNRD